MNNEHEILCNSVASIINIHPTNDMFLRIMTSRDITVMNSELRTVNLTSYKNNIRVIL